MRRTLCFTVARLNTATAEVLQAFNQSYSAIAASREAEARRFAAILGIAVEARSTFLLGD